jgi:mannose-6-phosphate isomerase-like protein (cupin superfamily)
MITKQDFQNIISSPIFFERGLIYVIENIKGEYVKDYNIREKCSSYNEFLDILSVLTKDKHTLKVQGIEFFNKSVYQHCKKLSNMWGKPVDCHAYWGYKGQGSFAVHTDPCEVCIYICEGTKQVDLDQTHVLDSGQHIYIKPDTPHKAMNLSDCLSLSFGTFDYDHKRVGDIGFKL